MKCSRCGILNFDSGRYFLNLNLCDVCDKLYKEEFKKAFEKEGYSDWEERQFAQSFPIDFPFNPSNRNSK